MPITKERAVLLVIYFYILQHCTKSKFWQLIEYKNTSHTQSACDFFFCQNLIGRRVEMSYQRLRIAMKKNHDTYDDLGAVLGLPKSAISMRINKKTDFRISEIKKILKRYDKKFEELF
jgi:hypothetical protein